MADHPTHYTEIQTGSLRWLTPPDAPAGTKQIQAKVKHVSAPDADFSTAIISEGRDLGPTHSWAKMLAGEYGPIADYIHPAPEPDGSGHLVVATGGVLSQSRATSDLNSALEVSWHLTPHMPDDWGISADGRVLRFAPVRSEEWVRHIYVQALHGDPASAHQVQAEILLPYGHRQVDEAGPCLAFGTRHKRVTVVQDQAEYSAPVGVKQTLHFLLPVGSGFAAADDRRIRVGLA